MDDNIRRAKKLLESKGYRVSKVSYDQSLFDHLRDVKSTPIRESVGYDYVECEEDYSYDEDESLYEDLASTESLRGDQLKKWYPGSVVTTNSYSENSGTSTGKHYVMVIDSVDEGDDGVLKYRGFLISTKVDKANKNNPKYPNNLYIDDVRSIFYGHTYVSSSEALIRVDDLVEFTSRDIYPSRSYKGKVSNKFWRFVANGSSNCHSGKDYMNRRKYWISNKEE